ncbi:MAG: GNAT family N-acetyltransferase [Myxococcales bacterium]|nr:GNAT family N-acetyltransferase [Myxococcales bacterium]
MSRRIERLAADDGVRLVAELRHTEPLARCIAAGGGQIVLCGPGMYVNRAIGIGMDDPVTDAFFETLESEAAQVGVPPAIEVCPHADPTLVEGAARRGYALRSFRSVLTRQVQVEDAVHVDLDVALVGRDVDLATWQRTAVLGFEIEGAEAQSISDRFSAAWSRVEGQRFLVARVEGVPAACAVVDVRQRVAQLGGMCTVPAYRRRGLQQALLRVRLAHAAHVGADLAVATADPGSSSERNLLQAGFVVAYTRAELRRS